MAETVFPTIPDQLYPLLQSERFVTLATIDHETGAPNVGAISWVYAPDQQVIRFAVDRRSRMVENIKKNPSLVLTLIGAESCFAIAGKAHVAVDVMEGVPLKLSRVDIQVTEVRDAMFYGAKIETEPHYVKTYDLEAATKLDNQVMNALKA